MHAIRAFFRTHRRLALALVVLALAMKALTPAGFMPAAPGKVLTVMICDGQGDMQAAKIAIPGESKTDTGSAAKGDSVCPYAWLSFAALGGTDALLAAALLLFILASAFAPARIPPLRRGHRVLPPPCGPPAFA